MSLPQLARLPVLDHQRDVKVAAVQLDALGQPIAALLHITEVLNLPAILFQGGQAAIAIEAQAALAVRRGQAANTPDQVRDWKLPADLLFKERLR